MDGSEGRSENLTLEEIGRVLASGAHRLVEVADVAADDDDDDDDDDDVAATTGSRGTPTSGPRLAMSYSHLDHALQTAAVLRAWAPDDQELQVAGLVHDIGHLLPHVGDVEHAAAGAAAVREALGDRVAALVGLHVEAKRYLVAIESGYGGELAADSVASLGLQGGPMTDVERQAFARSPYFADAVRLRRADESGKVEGLAVGELGEWMAVVRSKHRHAG